ncbi:hypothetical protein TNIN_226661 [Trichonephila inaurata madagascariensis]|uniref:Uncharacterized protein n=1 Tax=Trichonephila inaurata madagascariensis TaxID=2747483 RepID=A0A8X7CCX7_9ARAC|nr:hypothetical protein TNIN_226661 [Trichonephila inaurata madagascariensis]
MYKSLSDCESSLHCVMDQIESQPSPNEEMLSLESPPSPSLLASSSLLFNALSSNEVQPHTEVEPSNTEVVQHVEALDTEVVDIHRIMNHSKIEFVNRSISTICLS